MKHVSLFALPLLLTACSGQGSGNGSSDLPAQPDRWVQAVTVQPDTKIEHVGKTSALLSSTSIRQVGNVRKIATGDTVDGITIGAIKCTFFPHDSAYGGEQFMWRGRWGCMAGRSKLEVAGAVKEDGTKAFDYINLSPITL